MFLEQQLLLAHILGKERAWVLAHPEFELNELQQQQYHQSIEKLKKGVPLAYILGEKEFYGLPFWVDEHVLIPRAETEHLVDCVIDWLRKHPTVQYLLEVGVGSGCVAISIACQIAYLQVVGVDISWHALQIAQKNSARHNVNERIALFQGNLCSPFSFTKKFFNIICANLPYVATKEALMLQAEPKIALDGGIDGLALYRRFIPMAYAKLRSPGALFFELGAGQAEMVKTICHQSIPKNKVSFIKDYAGWDRVCIVSL